MKETLRTASHDHTVPGLGRSLDQAHRDVMDKVFIHFVCLGRRTVPVRRDIAHPRDSPLPPVACVFVKARCELLIHTGNARYAVHKLAIQQFPPHLHRDQVPELCASTAILARDSNYTDQSSPCLSGLVPGLFPALVCASRCSSSDALCEGSASGWFFAEAAWSHCGLNCKS
jgi:hypothetical protein